MAGYRVRLEELLAATDADPVVEAVIAGRQRIRRACPCHASDPET